MISLPIESSKEDDDTPQEWSLLEVGFFSFGSI